MWLNNWRGCICLFGCLRFMFELAFWKGLEGNNAFSVLFTSAHPAAAAPSVNELDLLNSLCCLASAVVVSLGLCSFTPITPKTGLFSGFKVCMTPTLGDVGWHFRLVLESFSYTGHGLLSSCLPLQWPPREQYNQARILHIRLIFSYSVTGLMGLLLRPRPPRAEGMSGRQLQGFCMAHFKAKNEFCIHFV